MKRRDFLKNLISAPFLFLLSSCSSQSFKSQKNDSNFKFVFCSDLHARLEWGVPEILDNAAEKINKTKPDLIICGGDLISDGLSISKEEYLRRFDVFKKFNNKLNAPLFSVAGNHDLRRDDFSKNDFLRHSGLLEHGISKPYYLIETKDINFICLDTAMQDDSKDGYLGEVDSLQLKWLKLKTNKLLRTKPIILISHIPFLKDHSKYFYNESKNVPATHYVKNYNEVLKLFIKHNVLAVIQGHTHLKEELNLKGISSITAPAICGNWWCSDLKSLNPGFVAAEIRRGELFLDFIDLDFDTTKPC